MVAVDEVIDAKQTGSFDCSQAKHNYSSYEHIFSEYYNLYSDLYIFCVHPGPGSYILRFLQRVLTASIFIGNHCE